MLARIRLLWAFICSVGLLAFTAGAIAGALYGVALRRRGEVSDAVADHATTNVLLLAFVAATGRWDLWG